MLPGSFSRPGSWSSPYWGSMQPWCNLSHQNPCAISTSHQKQFLKISSVSEEDELCESGETSPKVPILGITFHFDSSTCYQDLWNLKPCTNFEQTVFDGFHQSFQILMSLFWLRAMILRYDNSFSVTVVDGWGREGLLDQIILNREFIWRAQHLWNSVKQVHVSANSV